MQPSIKEITGILEEVAPLSLQEKYDNSGLLVGHPETKVSKAIVAVDVTEAVVDEAIRVKADLVIAHHPIIFSGIKRLNGSSYVERVVMKAIKHDIAIYAIHTNLDNVLHNGVNRKIADKLGLVNTAILDPMKDRLQKLVCFCPADHAETVRDAIFKAGAGHIGKYSDCSFSSAGKGTFRPGEGTDPYSGSKGELSSEDELRLEVILPSHLSSAVVRAMKEAHPYEEVAFDLYDLRNEWQEAGAGLIGELKEPMGKEDFLKLIRSSMKAPCIRYTETDNDRIGKVAVCGGSGSFLLNRAIGKNADAFLTADFKYHQFFDSEGRIMICDIGHYESEQFTAELIIDILEAGFKSKKIANFAVILTETVTNPVRYFI